MKNDTILNSLEQNDQNEVQQLMMKLQYKLKQSCRYLKQDNYIYCLVKILFLYCYYNDEEKMCNFIIQIAKLRLQKGDIQNAIYSFNSLKKIGELKQNINYRIIGFLGLADCCLKCNRARNSIQFYIRALQLSIVIQNRNMECYIYDLIGYAYFQIQDVKSAKVFHQRSMNSEFEKDGTILKNQYIREFNFYENKLKMIRQSYQNLSANSYTFQLLIGILYKDENGVRLTQIDIEKLQTFTEKSQAFSFETEISIDEQIFNINEGIDMKREIMNPINCVADKEAQNQDDRKQQMKLQSMYNNRVKKKKKSVRDIVFGTLNNNFNMSSDAMIEHRNKTICQIKKGSTYVSDKFELKLQGLYNHMSPNNNFAGFNFYKNNNMGQYFLG